MNPRPRKNPEPRGAFAERFRALRVSRGLSQAEAAEALGVHLVTVSRWEVGMRTPRGLALRAVEAWMKKGGKRGKA